MTDELSVPAGILQYGSEPRNTQKHLHNILQHTFKAVKTLLIQSYKVNEGKVGHNLSVSFFYIKIRFQMANDVHKNPLHLHYRSKVWG